MTATCRTHLASALAATLAAMGLVAVLALAGGARAETTSIRTDMAGVDLQAPAASAMELSGTAAATSALSGAATAPGTPPGAAAATSTPSAAATSTSSSAAATRSTATSTPSSAAAAAAATGSAAWHELTPDELKLPIFNRLNVDLERGEALLSDVKDNNPGYDESAFYYLIQLALKDPDALKPNPDDTVDYETLMAMPSSYRGKAVSIEGLYMSCLPFAPPPIAVRKDIQKVYRVDLRELPDDGTEKPYATVIVLDNPMEYLHVQDPVRVRAYFYKVLQYKYSSGKGTGSAPLLVARRLEPLEAPRAAAPVSEKQVDRWTMMIGVGLVVLVAAGFFTARQLVRSKQNAGPKRQVYQFNLHREHRKRVAGDAGPGDKDSGPKP